MILSIPINTRLNKKSDEWKGGAIRKAWVREAILLQIFFPLKGLLLLSSPFLLQIFVTFSCHWCCSLPADKVQTEKAVGLDCFQNRSRQSLTLRPSSRKSLLLLPHAWDCAMNFSWCLCSVILWKELHLEWRNAWAKFGSLGNFRIWLGLKLMYMSETEHKFFSIFAALAFVYQKWWWCSVSPDYAFCVWLAFDLYRWGDQSMGHCCGHYEDWWNLSDYV